jgi:hypothetical protein
MRQRFYASYPALVRDVHDPMRSGRIKVECPPLYGVSHLSPWCLPKHATHLWSVPYEGSTVWVSLRQGDPAYPIWEGRYTTYAEASAPSEFRALSEGPYKDDLRDAVDHQGDYDNADHAKGHDHSSGEFWNPYLHALIFPMGAGLLVDEEPGEQRLTLRDRIGQFLELVGDPSSPKDPHDETRIGGEYDAPALDDGSALYQGEGLRAKLRLQGRHSQFLEMRIFDEDQQEELELRGGDIAGTHGSHLTFSNSKLEKRFLLERLIPGYTQSYEAKIDPDNLTINYQRLYDVHGQEIKINANDVTPARSIEIKNAPGESIKLEHDGQKLTIKDRKGTYIEFNPQTDVWTLMHYQGDQVVLDGSVINVQHKSGSQVVLSAGAVDLSAPLVRFATGLATINGKPIAVTGDPCMTPVGPGTVIGTGN